MIRLLGILAMALLAAQVWGAESSTIAKPDALEAFTGYYQADPHTHPDMVVDIGRRADRLSIQIPGFPRINLEAGKPGEFSYYLPEAQTMVTLAFRPEKDGHIEKLLMRRDGTETVMTRINVRTALDVIDRAMLNGWFSSAPGLSSLPAPGVPPLPTWALMPRTATSIPLGTAALDGAPPSIASIPLAKFGYVEEEYAVSGLGNIYAIGGKRIWRTDLPYTTRILVRRPANPKAFSGTVHMEPAQDDTEAVFTVMDAWPYFVRNGDIFVTWTASKNNVPALLQKFDPQRYGALTIPANGLRWDMMGQIAWLLRSPDGPLGKMGFVAAATQKNGGLRIYATGSGPTAEMIALFLNSGFHAQARTPVGDPVIDAYVPAMNIQRIAPQDDAYVMRIMTETEFNNPGTYDQPGAWVTRPAFRGQSVNLREYHIAGASHFDWHNQPQFSMVTHQLGLNADATPRCSNPIAQLPGKAHITRALYAALDQWVREGKNPPNTRLFLLDPEHMPVRDPISQNIVGSLRPFWINVPTAHFGIDNTALDKRDVLSAATCKFYAYQEPFPKARLAELYNDRATYLERVAQHLERMVQQRYLLPEDVAEERALAERVAIP